MYATSRHPLGVEGETTWRVPSLAVPPQAADPATFDRFDAVRLFAERARQARAEVTLTPAVAQICRRLDGIPLALELAAARVGGVPIDRLRGQVDAFAGFGYTIRRTYGDSGSETDGAVVEWTMSGDYAGKPVSLDIVMAYDFLRGRIVSERNYWDNAALQAQLS